MEKKNKMKITTQQKDFIFRKMLIFIHHSEKELSPKQITEEVLRIIEEI